jgi:hypothetical protein
MVNTLRTSLLIEDAAIQDDSLIAAHRQSARRGCFLHLYDLTLSHPEIAPPTAVKLVRRWEAAARERLNERQKREGPSRLLSRAKN